MPRSSAAETATSETRAGHRGQVEPFAALVAVAVVGTALALYAGAFEAALPGSPDRSLAEPTADRIERALTHGGVVDPGGLARAVRRGPEGYRVNATLEYADESRAVGPAPPADADAASRRVSVELGPGAVRPGRLEVHVWS